MIPRDPTTSASPTNLAEAKPEAPPAPGAATLLLVDDEPLVRLSTAELLRELGYEVIAASSAAEALDLIRTGLKPDVLVTDHKMPGTTGAQLASQPRLKLPTLPVLLVTGYANPIADDVDGLEVLAKPFAFAELAVRLANLLTASATGARLAPSTG
jgi:CheY-like chemotaxis protein